MRLTPDRPAPSTVLAAATSDVARSPWAVVPALVVASGAVLMFGMHQDLWGYGLLVAGVASGLLIGRQLAGDLLLIALGLGIVGSISVEANLDYLNMLVFGTVLTLSVLVPYLIDRYVYRHRTIRFPRRRGEPWTRLEKAWLVIAVILAWLILPTYFIRSGAYQNWPPIATPDEIARLFVGVNVVGIWDELFFICTVFTLLRRHLPDWQAIPVQSIIFVSFLWELGYREWGPFLTIPFTMVQAYVFTKTRSLPYVITIHLLFDAIVFLVLVHAHHPDWLRIFLY